MDLDWICVVSIQTDVITSCFLHLMCEICVYHSSLHVTVLHVMDVFLVTALLLFRLCDSRESRHRQRAQLPWNKTMAVFNTEQTNRSIRRSRRQREAATATCYMSLNVKIQNRRCGSAAAQEQKGNIHTSQDASSSRIMTANKDSCGKKRLIRMWM